MSLEEHGSTVADKVVAELVDCPLPDAPAATPTPATPDTSPTEQAAEATIEQTGADPPPFASLHAELRSLRTNILALSARVHRVESWIDTVSSPLHKRILFVLQGYRWRTLGRWYPPEWKD